jgi:flagellar basal-body rod protein FlgF
VINGVDTAYSGMRAQMDALDILSNNLANVSTTAYKEEKPFFAHLSQSGDSRDSDELNAAVNDRAITALGAFNTGNGSFTPTNRDFDIAISGDGYLVVDTPRGPRYTRNGSLMLNSKSVLSTEDGYPVLGANRRPITLSTGKVIINSDGEVYLDDTRVDQLKRVKFDPGTSLQREGGSLIAAAGDQAAERPSSAQIKQGYLEQSNVNPINAVVTMVGIMRQFEAIQKSVDLLVNNISAKSIERLGR